ncbi:hypothetical protein A6R68_09552, partial [Neotoma lepida]
TPSSSLPKRTREEEEDSTVEAADQVSDDTVEMPLPKKLKTVTPVGTEDGQGKGDDVIVIDSDDEDDDEENDGEHEDYEEDEDDDDDDEDDTGMGDEGEDSNEGTGSADGNDGYEADDAESLHFVLRVVMGLTQVQKQKKVWAELKVIRELLILKTVQQHFFDDEDRTVPSTPTLVVPHRTDGFAEAIHSPQVAGVPRFRFGPPEDMPQTSSSHSDLGQLASQGGLGMYETPLFLAHEEESGGRSVPTTPLQVAAPVTVFTESTTSDASEHASQSVPMVTTSTGTLSTTNETAAGDDGDEVFVEAESEGISSEAGLEIDSQQEEEPVQASDESDLPSTSQDPPSSSSVDTSSSQPKPFRRVRLQTTLRPGVRGRQFNRQRGVSHAMGGRGGLNRGNIN